MGAQEGSGAGDEFPAVWFEVPLAGRPRFDLHVAISREALAPGAAFAPGSGNGYERLLRWYADDEPGGAGLAFAYDVSGGAIDSPAVHVNTNNAPLSNIRRFFSRLIFTPRGLSTLPNRRRRPSTTRLRCRR